MDNSSQKIFVLLTCWLLLLVHSSIQIDLWTETIDYELNDGVGGTNNDATNSSSNRMVTMKPLSLNANYNQTSPYQVVPGSYSSIDNQYYVSPTPYKVVSIFTNYLTTGAYQYHSPSCVFHYGQVPKITETDIANAFNYANEVIKTRYPEYSNASHYKGVHHKEVEGYLMELASEYFAKFKCFSKYQLSTYLPSLSVANQYYYLNKQGDASCLPFYNENYKCYPFQTSKYRTLDGSCNNLKSPYWGRSFTCHIRLLPPDYSDGIQAFRMSKSGYELPNPRIISNYVTVSKDMQSYYTALVLIFGQFTIHDISSTEGHLAAPKSKIDCCEHSSNKCAAIPVYSRDDYLLNAFNTKCLNFVRSSPCPLCKFGPREQINVQTSFLDASQVYGASLEESQHLRSFQKGLLLAYSDKFGNLILPPNPEHKSCAPAKPGLTCFKAGDERVNQHPFLLTMHTLLLRNHNHHALKLGLVNPHWNDERLFQEARRITIAEIQHITFNEYLPIILGPMLMTYYRLQPLKTGYTKYEPFTDPSTWNEFISAASRYGHSQIKDYYKLINSRANYSFLALRDNFNEPGFAHDGLLDDIIRGITGDVANTVDPFYSHTVKNFVMHSRRRPLGLDLVATNVQRGRDHGIPGYVHYLKACFNFDATSWSDLEKFIPAETLFKLKSIYGSIEDIDLYIAGVAERHFIDASIGPTFGCLVGIQYNHIKYGDRYFYEHGFQSGSFTPAQLDNIRQTTSMARLLCRNSRLQAIQPAPFYLPSQYNKLVDCRSYPEINYYLWKE